MLSALGNKTPGIREISFFFVLPKEVNCIFSFAENHANPLNDSVCILRPHTHAYTRKLHCKLIDIPFKFDVDFG